MATLHRCVVVTFIVATVELFLIDWSSSRPRGDPWRTAAIYAADLSWLLSVLFTSHYFRRASADLLGRLAVAVSGEARTASSVAGLCGGIGAHHALALARRRFRCLPLSSLQPADIGDGQTDLSQVRNRHRNRQ